MNYYITKQEMKALVKLAKFIGKWDRRLTALKRYFTGRTITKQEP